MDVGQVERRLARANAKIKVLESMIEDKTRVLYLAQEELRGKTQFLQGVLESMYSAVIMVNGAGVVSGIAGATERMTGLTEAQLVGRAAKDVIRPDEGTYEELTSASGSTQQAQLGIEPDWIPVLVTSSPNTCIDGSLGRVLVASDLREQRRLEIELRHAQKLESVGQLAAGVAHEINTPIQYVGDSVAFLAEVLTDGLRLIHEYGRLRAFASDLPDAVDIIRSLEELEDEIDLEFMIEEAPRSIERTNEGVKRVAEIVAALKQFSHPGGGDLGPTNLNEVVTTALTVARSEYKYVAEIELDLGEVAEITGDRGDLGQVILNLVVNASHAIADVIEGTGTMGTIAISTRNVDGGVELAITDTGGGIPEEIRERVFDPFFTTKEPGRGTGQGLAITRSIIVEKHAGRLDLEVQDGRGSTFRAWLPAA